jgi:hypothetical protein
VAGTKEGNSAIKGVGMDRKWTNWVTFGSVLMMIVGAFKLISGIIGLFRDEWLVLGYNGYLLVDITGLAVWYLCVGAILFLGGGRRAAGQHSGGDWRCGRRSCRHLRVLHDPHYPIWSIIMLILYVIVLVAFIAWKGPSPYGSEDLPATEAAPYVPRPQSCPHLGGARGFERSSAGRGGPGDGRSFGHRAATNCGNSDSGGPGRRAHGGVCRRGAGRETSL